MKAFVSIAAEDVRQKLQLALRNADLERANLCRELKASADTAHEAHMATLTDTVTRFGAERREQVSEHRAAVERLLAEKEERLRAAQDVHCAEFMRTNAQLQEVRLRHAEAEAMLLTAKAKWQRLEEDRETLQYKETALHTEAEAWRNKVAAMEAKIEKSKEVSFLSP